VDYNPFDLLLQRVELQQFEWTTAGKLCQLYGIAVVVSATHHILSTNNLFNYCSKEKQLTMAAVAQLGTV
jgi:hypothetical protein